MVEINGFSETQLINLFRLAIDLAGDGGCSPWTDRKNNGRIFGLLRIMCVK